MRLVIALVAAIVVFAEASLHADDKVQRTVTLQGEWQAESIDGRAITEAEPVKVVFSDGKVEGLFRLVDPDARVKGDSQLANSFDFRVFRHGEFNAIDVDVGGKAAHGTRGLYKIEGDALIMAFQPKLDARSVSPWVDKDGRPNTVDPAHVVLRVFRRGRR